MFRNTMITGFLLAAAAAAPAATFTPAPYLVDANVETLTSAVARQMVDRQLFGTPYATVVVGNVDVYDTFPYLEAHYFQVVSDPQWNRLLYGEADRGLAAFDGAGTDFGPLRQPRGMSTDAQGRVYVADTGGDRVLVFATAAEYDQLTLRPLFAITGLARPHDVAYSDGGTPFDPADDLLYVADTGHNAVARFQLVDGGATPAGTCGELGSGRGRFAGPTALTVGRRDGAHTDQVYVADAHNGRVVVLRDTGDGLAWSGEAANELGLVTSLDTDHWGNVYAAAPRAGVVAKLTRDLQPLATMADGDHRPRSFHVPFVTTTDHRDGKVIRAGQGRGLLVEQWSGESGLKLLNLGVEILAPQVAAGREVSVALTLTDQADVTAEIVDPASGRVLARHAAGALASGRQTVRLTADDQLAPWDAGRYELRLRATSTYGADDAALRTLAVDLAANDGAGLPARLALLGNTPNPFNPSTTIAFAVPAGPPLEHRLRVYDARGLLVRELAAGTVAPGRHEVVWDGRDARGGAVGAGVYLYRLDVGDAKLTGKMVLVK